MYLKSHPVRTLMVRIVVSYSITRSTLKPTFIHNHTLKPDNEQHIHNYIIIIVLVNVHVQ